MTTTPTLWKPQTQVNTTDAAAPVTGASNAQFLGHVTGLDDGGFVIIWTDTSRVHNPGGTAVLAQRYDVRGEPVGGEVKVSGFNNGNQAGTSVIQLSDGKIAIAFNDSFEGNSDIYVAVFDAALNFLRRDFIDVQPQNSGNASLTALSDGGYMASYTVSNSFDDQDVVGRTVSAEGVVGAQFDILSQGVDRKSSPELATLSDGNVVVVFDRGPSSDPVDVMFGILGPTGAPIVTPQFVAGAADSGVEERSSDVAALAGGGFVVVWSEFGQEALVRASIYTNTGAPGPRTDFMVNPIPSGSHFGASVVALPDGGFVVTWKDRDSQFTIGQRFDANGQTVGTLMPVKKWGDDGENSGGVTIDSALLGDGRIVYAIGDTATGDQDVVTSIWDPRTSTINGTSGSESLTSRRDGATVNGGGGDDTLWGAEGDDVLNGGAGDDTLFGGLLGSGSGISGRDRLNGGRGADQMLGFDGDDTYLVDDAGDHVSEAFGDGNDSVFASVSFILPSGVENLRLTGSTAIDGTGNTLANDIRGNGAANVLDGDGDNDTLTGLDGNDVLTGGPGADRLDGGTGRDAASYSTATAGVSAHLGDPGTNTGDAAGDSYVSVEDLIGSPFNDTLRGNAGSNRLLGEAGDDALLGAAGRDTLRGGGGSDTLDGGSDRDTLSGQGGHDRLRGGPGNDVLHGNADNDVLHGGLGDDTLFGDPGNDRFIFGPNGGIDRVKDFEDGLDRLDLTAFNFSSVSEAKSFASDVDGDVVFNFAGGERLIVENIVKSQLTADDILV